MSHSIPSPDGNDAKIADVLGRTRATLRRVELALGTFPDTGDRERQVAAMHNVVVTGRRVTFVLKNMQHAAPNFWDWYEPWVQEMRQDPLLRYFKDLRNKIEKQGKERVTVNLLIGNFDSERHIPDAPPGAVAFFMGDHNGGMGWDVRLEDGTVQRIYYNLPKEVGRTRFGFEDLPGRHLGSPITEDSLENVCRLYVRYLRRLVESAEERFSPA